MKKFFYYEPGSTATMMLFLRRTLVLCNFIEQLIQHPAAKRCGIRSVFYSAIFISALLLATSCKSKAREDAAAINSDIYYTCSMHPQIMQEKPGNCTVCGMKLIEAKKSATQKVDEIQLSDEQIQLGNIQVDTIRNGAIADKQVLIATLNFNQQQITAVSTRVPGRIEKLWFKNIGDYVHKGDKLFDIYSEELNNAKQEYLLALNKQKALDNSLIDFKQLIESAKNKLALWGLSENQIATLDTTHTSSPLTSYYSNESGYITSLDIKEGDYVTEGGSVVKLAGMSTLWAEAQVYTAQLSVIDKAGTATVQIPDLNNIEIKGKIEFVNPEINPDTRINLIRIAVPNRDKQLRPGMPVYVYLSSTERKGLNLPIDAVIRNQNSASVWIKTAANTFKNKMVETGLETGNSIEIISGLTEGEAVVISGVYLLNSEYIFQRGADPMAGMDMSGHQH